MAFEIKHNFTSAKSDGVDTTLVQPSNWNEAHDFTLSAADRLVGRATSGAGAAEEITLGAGVVLASGALVASNGRFAGSVSGAASNAMTVALAGYTLAQNSIVWFLGDASNTAATTLNIGATGVKNVLRPTDRGLVALTGGEIRLGMLNGVLYDGTQYQLLPTFPTDFGRGETIASASTVDLGTAKSNRITISGTTTVTALGSTATLANPVYLVTFDGVLTLTHNGTSLISPTGANITTAAGDTMLVELISAGNWRIRAYFRANGRPLVQSVDLGTEVTTGTVCLQRVRTATTGASAYATTIPVDNTIPQISEGTQVFSLAITPRNASSYLYITADFEYSWYTSGTLMVAALFRDGAADAIGVSFNNLHNGTLVSSHHFRKTWRIATSSVSATTFTLRVGGNIAFNLADSAYTFGGLPVASLVIEEWLDV